jgi:uncharacterized membrane protein
MSKKVRTSESGTIMVLFAACLAPLIACFALMVDGGNIFTSKLQQEANAEYAAMAALEEFIFCREQDRITNFNTCAQRSIVVAEQTANLNLYLGSNHNNETMPANGLVNRTHGKLEFGLYINNFAPANAVGIVNSAKVELNNTATNSNRLKSYFSHVLGIKGFDIISSGIAAYNSTRASSGLSPYEIKKLN